jgi:hypothetical protein
VKPPAEASITNFQIATLPSSPLESENIRASEDLKLELDSMLTCGDYSIRSKVGIQIL